MKERIHTSSSSARTCLCMRRVSAGPSLSTAASLASKSDPDGPVEKSFESCMSRISRGGAVGLVTSDDVIGMCTQRTTASYSVMASCGIFVNGSETALKR